MKFNSVVPVLPSQNIERDVEWYEQYVGFKKNYADKMYAVLQRNDINIHIQWHADTVEDPLLGGSVIRIMVDDIRPIFEEFVNRGTVKENKLNLNTAWGTNEFSFYDLNKNAVFLVESL